MASSSTLGSRKRRLPAEHDPVQLYKRVLVEAIKRIDDFCEQDREPPNSFIVILDEHVQRSALITVAAQSMYGNAPRRHLIEPPFHAESHRYQTLQAADWIAGLVGRLGAIWAAPADYPENEPFRDTSSIGSIVRAGGAESGPEAAGLGCGRRAGNDRSGTPVGRSSTRQSRPGTLSFERERITDPS